MTTLSIAQIHDLAEIRLRQSQLRYTKGRRAIVEALAMAGHPLSIASIEEAAPELPRSSAYRHLVDLQEVGAVRSISVAGDFTHFELAEDLTEHHHHLICLQCGSIRDVASSSVFEDAIDAAAHEFAAQTGFQPLSHSLDIMGYCEQCRH
jgi:Fe2+ or Zn2+ uptake regulation protein